MATYTNTATGETYKLAGVKTLAQAWGLAKFVANRNGWNLEMFSYDVKVKIEKN
jgi:hypothetical protein